MNLPKSIRQIYREETGKDAEIASPLEGFELAVYVEAPSKDYIDWLERRASASYGSANTSTNSAMVPCQKCKWSKGSQDYCSRCRWSFRDYFDAQHQ